MAGFIISSTYLSWIFVEEIARLQLLHPPPHRTGFLAGGQVTTEPGGMQVLGWKKPPTLP
jgi:hypothetical protein